MKHLILIPALLLASCALRHLPATPSMLTIHATAATCESVPMSDTKSAAWAECRYTVEDENGIHVRRIEFRKAR